MTLPATDAPTLLEVRGAAQALPGQRGHPRAQGRRGEAVDGVDFHPSPRETLGLVGESGLRQDDNRPMHPAARAADRRRDPL